MVRHFLVGPPGMETADRRGYVLLPVLAQVVIAYPFIKLLRVLLPVLYCNDYERLPGFPSADRFHRLM